MVLRSAKELSGSAADPERDSFETALAVAFLDAGKPILGICRGFQLLNVIFGGSLWQDIPSRFGSVHDGGILHRITVVPGSFLESRFDSDTKVNSFHHQAVKRLGTGLRVSATAAVGVEEITEAFEHETLPVWGVQWHPERTVRAGTAETGLLAGTDMAPLFRMFANICGAWKAP